MPSRVERPPLTEVQRQTLKDFYVAYESTVRGYVASLMQFEHTPEEVDDVCSEVWEKAARMWAKFDVTKSAQGNPKAWMKTLAYRVFVDWYRSKKLRMYNISLSRQIHEDNKLTYGDLVANMPQESTDDHPVHPRTLRAALIVCRLMSARQARANRMRFKERSSQQIGAALETSEVGARKLVHEGQRTARYQLARYGITTVNQLLMWDKVIA